MNPEPTTPAADPDPDPDPGDAATVVPESSTGVDFMTLVGDWLDAPPSGAPAPTPKPDVVAEMDDGVPTLRARRASLSGERAEPDGFDRRLVKRR